MFGHKLRFLASLQIPKYYQKLKKCLAENVNKPFSVILENEERRPPEEFEATKNLSSDSAERNFSVVITTTHDNAILITTVILRKSGTLL